MHQLNPFLVPLKRCASLHCLFAEDPSDDDDDDSFNEKKKHTGKPKSRLGKAGREKAKKKKSPEKKRTSTRQKHSQEVVELDSDDESQNE